MASGARWVVALAAVVGGLAAAPARGDQAGDGPSSPYIVGTWRFDPGGGTPTVDTEFRFVNPTPLAVTLEYAFYELDGTF